jgi:hypothetical protein
MPDPAVGTEILPDKSVILTYIAYSLREFEELQLALNILFRS